MTDYRDIAIEMVEAGMIGPMTMLTACLKYMSNDEVKDMLDINEFTYADEEEQELNAYYNALAGVTLLSMSYNAGKK